mmetsp:Transcript_27121/g.65822  ORF Transcript_27121/g.65822 Transcript_27121/m.65822 type:complete len:206 (+) Transcript_27121:355-972(+)
MNSPPAPSISSRPWYMERKSIPNLSCISWACSESLSFLVTPSVVTTSSLGAMTVAWVLPMRSNSDPDGITWVRFVGSCSANIFDNSSLLNCFCRNLSWMVDVDRLRSMTADNGRTLDTIDGSVPSRMRPQGILQMFCCVCCEGFCSLSPCRPGGWYSSNSIPSNQDPSAELTPQSAWLETATNASRIRRRLRFIVNIFSIRCLLS